MNHDSSELFGLFVHFVLLSFLAIGGAITTIPDMHRYLVTEHHWLSDAQFSASVAIAQAAPGPNVLFVAVLGYNVAGLPGTLATMGGILGPSSVLALWATRWSARRRETRFVRAFTAGLAPLTLGLLVSTSWVLAQPFLLEASHRWGALALIAITVLVMMRTRLSPLWLVALGLVVGAAGFA